MSGNLMFRNVASGGKVVHITSHMPRVRKGYDYCNLIVTIMLLALMVACFIW